MRKLLEQIMHAWRMREEYFESDQSEPAGCLGRVFMLAQDPTFILESRRINERKMLRREQEKE
jgi:hypothetical protein